MGMDERKIQLLETERLRHLALMRADRARKEEHQEVARAIQWALETLKGEAGRT